MTKALKVDYGPWHVITDAQATRVVSSDNEYDVVLVIKGDFPDEETLIDYARNIAARLSRPL